MSPALLLAVGLLAAPSDVDARAAYEKARSEAGRDADAQVRLALWCEAHGLHAERLKHLALATLRDPTHATARGLMGLVAYRGKWQSPDAVADRIKADRKLADALAAYNFRRERMPDTADAHWQLAVWCEQNGLSAEATAHLASVVRIDPSRESAWKRLGYHKFEGRWVTDDQVAAAKADVVARTRADRTWTPLLEKWKGWLAREDRRAEAEAGLLDITDPYAVGPIVKVFAASDKASHQARAVRLLGQIDTPASARALAAMTVRSEDDQVRRAAREVLSHRDPREFVGVLIGSIRDPIKAQKWSDVDRYGRINSYLNIEGPQANIQFNARNRNNYPVPNRLFAAGVPFDPYGIQAYSLYETAINSSGAIDFLKSHGITHASPAHDATATPPGAAGHTGGVTINPASALVYNLTLAASIRDAQIAQQIYWNQAQPQNSRYLEMVEAVERHNELAERGRTQIFATLRLTTGQGLPDDKEAWKTWYADSLGYSYRSPGADNTVDQPKPTIFVSLSTSCFGAGTPVRTLAGDRPIESLRVGDQVLAQDIGTGALAYRPIVRVLHNPPSPTFRVAFGGETVVATGIHRFWKAGRGWAMARDLKPGDVLPTLAALATVESVEPDRVQPVFNLDVAGDHDFFVGHAAALVHDNSLPDTRLVPFDATPALAAADEEPK